MAAEVLLVGTRYARVHVRSPLEYDRSYMFLCSIENCNSLLADISAADAVAVATAVTAVAVPQLLALAENMSV